MELYPSAICNLGAGISTGLSTVASEEGLLDAVVLTNEQGLIGGAPITDRDSGGAQNFAAMIEQTSQFNFYDGGLDLAVLSFAEVDAKGNVNISRFGDKIVGVGGFVNISQNARRVIFSGTFTAGGDDDANATLQTIRSGGRRTAFFEADIADIDRHDALLDKVQTSLGEVTCLVNNAGISVETRGDLLDVTPANFDRLIDVNLRGTFFLSQKLARRFVAEHSSRQCFARSSTFPRRMRF